MITDEKFLLGCCYYPEHWDEENMRHDISRIKNLGFSCIRMGEFSWSMYEKEEGKYDFSFLEQAVRIAEEYGINVILGTPTAAPPRWLTEKYPDVLCKDARGTLMEHGSRQHHNHTSETYLRLCAKITEAMVKHFSTFKSVVGWQIDNELNCHRNESYSDADDRAFRVWLKKKYGTVANLNTAWGNRFWSLEFSDFSQITCPRPNPAYNNPSWMYDYYHFLSDSVIHFAALQARIIREYMPCAFITHNGGFQNIDSRKFMNECLDIFAYDSYPSFQEKSGRGKGRNLAYRLSEMRHVSEKFLILEQQAGPGGQLKYLLPTPIPGQIRLWTYQSIANGAAGILYFRYRTALFGAEQLWYGIYDHDGEENYRSREVRKISEEINRVGNIFLRERLNNEVAIFTNYKNVTADKIECFTSNDAWYVFMNLNKHGIHSDFVDENCEFGKYKVIVFPHITIADQSLADKIEKFTDNGGIAIISARSGTKDDNMHFRPETAPGIFKSITKSRVEWFTTTPEGEQQYAEFDDGKRYLCENYYELLSPEGSDVIAYYTEGFPKGHAAVTRNGNTYYVGFYCKSSADLYFDIIKNHISYEPPISEYTECYHFENYNLYLNHSESSVSLEGFDEISESQIKELPGFGVALIKKLH